MISKKSFFKAVLEIWGDPMGHTHGPSLQLHEKAGKRLDPRFTECVDSWIAFWVNKWLHFLCTIWLPVNA